MGYTLVILTLGRQKRDDGWKFKANLVYIIRFHARQGYIVRTSRKEKATKGLKDETSLAHI